MSGSDTELEDEREDEVGYDDVLRRLARTLDDVEKLDVGLKTADDLGSVLPDVVVDALPLEPILDASKDSAAVLLREPHRELGKMLLDDDDGLTRARPEAALYHLAAAALGGDGALGSCGPCARRGTSGAGERGARARRRRCAPWPRGDPRRRAQRRLAAGAAAAAVGFVS